MSTQRYTPEFKKKQFTRSLSGATPFPKLQPGLGCRPIVCTSGSRQ